MEFIKYPSLENHYREKFIGAIEMNEAKDGEWFATEKLHGSNYSFYTNGFEVMTAKRSGFVGQDASFFNHQSIFEDNAEAILKLHDDLALTPDKQLVVYGELVGEGVQRGVSYCEGKGFFAFDVLIKHADGELEWLDYDSTLVEVLEECGFKVAPVVARGSFEDMLALDNSFNSRVTTGKEFTAEGLVIRPVQTAFLHSGSRIAIKSKSEKFSERKVSKTKTPPKELDEDAKAFLGVVDYITDNRLNNVMSKVGEVDKSMFPQLMGLLIQDAIEDFEKDTGKSWSDLDKGVRKAVQKELQKPARDLVKVAI